MSGRRATLLQAAAQLVNEAQLAEVDGRIDGIRDDINNVGTVVDTYGPQITDLIENRVLPWAVPTISPLSQTINRRADASFQLSDLSTPVLMGSTNPEGHNHTHTVETTSSRMFRAGSIKGQMYLAFITPAITREYERLNFMVAEAATPTAMLDVAVYVVDPDTRVLTRQVHVTNVAAALPIGEAVVTVPFPKWVAVQGSYIAVAFLWHGEGNTRHIFGIGEAVRPLPTDIIFPAKISARHVNTALTSLPLAVDGTTQVDFQNWYTPYAELSENIGSLARDFVESWPDVGTNLGRPWVHLTNPGVSSQGGWVGASGTGWRVSMYDTPMSSNYVRVTSSIHPSFDGNRTNSSNRATLIFRASNDMRSGVGVSAVGGARYELIEWTGRSPDGDWNNRTVIRTFGSAPKGGDTIEAEYLDGLVTVRINGVAYVESQIVGGPVGNAGRFVGVQTSRAGNAIVGYAISPRFGEWRARDLPQSGGEDDDDSGSSKGTG